MTKNPFIYLSLGLASGAGYLHADPQLDSWYTDNAGQYARIYKRQSNFTPDLTTTYTTWGQDSNTEQAIPSYADVQRIQYSSGSVYVEASGLASYVMGPWYKPNGGEYVSWPQNQQMIFRIPRATSVGSVPRDRPSAGYAGVFVNGMAAYGPLDGKAWADTAEASGQHVTTESDYYWFELAPVEEAFNFDAGNGHQPPTGIYHSHQSPIALRYQLGDHVDYDEVTNTYTEKAGLPTTHSPIVGWAKDGYPIYGPYGYDDPNDAGSGVRRMVSGFVIRDGSNGSDDVSSNLETIPEWYARFRFEQGVDATQSIDSSGAAYGNRPSLGTMALGSFAQDYSYLGDLTNPSDSQVYAQGEDFDLNAQNCRWCKTPEFPEGTYAYFITLDDAQDPTFPYTIGFEYYGDTSNQYGDVDSISESVTTHYVGGPNADLALVTPVVDGSNDEVTLTWNLVEGGTYAVESSTDNATWATESSFVADETTTHSSFTGNGGDGYAQVTRSAIATYDEVLNTLPSSTQADSEAYSNPINVIYVNAARTGQATQTGAEWGTAFADLQDALATAVAGDEIWVAAGVYYPDEAEAGEATVVDGAVASSFVLVTDVSVYGGFTGSETARSERDWEANVTILSGDLSQNDVTINNVVVTDPDNAIDDFNSDHVLTGGATGMELDGFTVTAGYGDDLAGGLVGSGSFRNCRFEGNYGEEAGAVFAESGTLQFVDCQFITNVSRFTGAIHSGECDLTMTSCVIQGNYSSGLNDQNVGGVRVAGGAATITNCLISGNVGSDVGGIFADFADGANTLGIYNSTLSGNYSWDSTPSSYSAGGLAVNTGMTVEVKNSIIWGNDSLAGAADAYGVLAQSSSLVKGANPGGTNLDGTDLANDPQFKTAITASTSASTSGDFRVDESSPVVNAGDDAGLALDVTDVDQNRNTAEALPLDVIGNARVLNGVLDIGAYEYSGPVVSTPITSNIEVETGASETQTIVNLDSLFGGDYSYAVVVHTAGVFASWDVDGMAGTFEVDPPFATEGATALVTVTATDDDGYEAETSFTVEVVAAYTPTDGLSQSLASWYTDHSSRFARIYETYADETAQTPVTTWDNGFTAQTTPVFAGPQEISYTDSYVIVKTANLSTHNMGPWYNNTGPGGSEEVFQNWPTNQDYTYQIPREPSIPTSKTNLPGGAIGLMVDGTVIFSTTDTFSWDNDEDGTGNGSDTGPGVQGGGLGDSIWLHEAVITEGNTFDQSNAHGAIDALHYHGSPTGLRYLLGDNMSYDASTNVYTPVMQGDDAYNNTHSPILGWMNDGFPLYGPFGFSDPDDATGDVRRMVSGFIKRDGTSGSYHLPTNGRNRLPAWVAEARGVSAALSVNEQGPDVDTDYPVGYFMEDYDFKGDLAAFSYYEGVGEFDDAEHYDLNQYNVRFCVTPEFPDGTWAYFTNVDAAGAPIYPYNVAQQYFGDPSNGGSISSIPTDDGSNVVTFEGGVKLVEVNTSTVIDAGDIVLAWSVVEGGSYTVESSTDLDNWGAELTDQVADSHSFGVEETISDAKKFYRITRTADPEYDGSDSSSAVSFGFTFATTPPLPPEGAISGFTVGGVSATVVSFDQNTGAVTLSFADSTLSSGSHSAQFTFTPPAGSEQVRTSTNSYTKP